MIPVKDAIRKIQEQTYLLPMEEVPLEVARGRFLAEPIIADSDLPPFDRAQMDGYAVRAADVQDVPAQLQIVGESAAGHGWHNELKQGQAVRIMTGAPVPEGADSVQQVEVTRELDKASAVEILEPVTHGRSIVTRGSEINKGATVLTEGAQINAAALAVLASFGYAEVKVRRRPRVAVLATGSELVPVNQKPGPDQIRDSNNYSIGAYAETAGAVIERLPVTSDDPEALSRQIDEAAERSDLVITSGGVSVGVYDFTKLALKELEAEFFFERVALRPGKPTVFARLPNGKLVFGLPGNPVSVSVTFNLFARTALLAMQGANEIPLTEQWAILNRSLKGSADRESYLPARVVTNEAGQLVAEPLKWGGSSDFVAFSHATTLINLAAGAAFTEAGSVVRIVYLPG